MKRQAFQPPSLSTVHVHLLSVETRAEQWGEIPFQVIERKYTEGTDSRPHAYNTLVYMYIEGEAWQEP